MRDGDVDSQVFRRAFESVGVPVMLIDGAFRIREINEAGLSFVGYDRAELVGSQATTVLVEDGTAEEISQRLATGRGWNGDVRLRTADGRAVHGQGSVAPIDSVIEHRLGADGGTVSGREDDTASGVGSALSTGSSDDPSLDPDDTARLPSTDSTGGSTSPESSASSTSSESSVSSTSSESSAPGSSDESGVAYVAAFMDARQKRQYENAAEVLDRLLRHDLRNDLNLVYGYVQQARSLIDDEGARDRLADARETLSEILDKSDRARDLRRLLDRAYEQPTYPVRLDYVLEECVERANEAYADATVETESLPAVRVSADELLSKALEGLIENGIVHDETDPRVVVSVERTETTAVVRVTDHGPGIPDDQATHVFGRGQTDALNHGDGLSLFFADSVVRSYDGRIWFEDAPDAGTTFKMELVRVER